MTNRVIGRRRIRFKDHELARIIKLLDEKIREEEGKNTEDIKLIKKISKDLYYNREGFYTAISKFWLEIIKEDNTKKEEK